MDGNLLKNYEGFISMIDRKRYTVRQYIFFYSLFFDYFYNLSEIMDENN